MVDAELTPHRVVYLGTAALQGGKTGDLWATEAEALAAADADDLRRAAVPFIKEPRSTAVGAVYEISVRLDAAGRLTNMSRNRVYRSMLDTGPVQAVALIEKGKQAREAAKKAEAKARAEGPANDLLDQLARIVAKGRVQDQELIIAGFASEVRKRALDIWRKSR